jgi:DNA-binding winged helix-turn-helix (wHTH) protein
LTIGFGDCVLDNETREVLRGGKPLHLQPKGFKLLEVLVERRPKAVSKEELMGLLWPKTFVAEGNLARLVAELREVIGDDAHEPRFIRTVHGFGYAFHGKAAPASKDRPVFKLIWGDREIALEEGENLLGRDPLSVACIDVASVSRHHARITVTGEEATIEDLGSKNGTWVLGRKLKNATPLHDGDALRLGSVPLMFRRFGSGGTTQTAFTSGNQPG